ncbi:hypothetical protein J4423_03830 [Candidatus Pacearchaeota archaeon]|nr:hypothetical protein [Candidatus Pacearchaeota archaeon]
MKINKRLIFVIWAIFLVGLIVFVRAQGVGNRISPRCNANGVVDVDYAYKVHAEEGYTNYIAILTAGRCEREFRGQVNAISDVESLIEADINNERNSRQLSFYPDPFGELDVDGRGYFSIP